VINLVVFAPSDDIAYGAPRGFAMVDGAFNQARLRDSISATQLSNAALRRTLSYLTSRYPGRIRTSWVNPWSLHGLIFSWRHRLRTFPSVILFSRQDKWVLAGNEIAHLEDRVVEILSRPPDAQS